MSSLCSQYSENWGEKHWRRIWNNKSVLVTFRVIIVVVFSLLCINYHLSLVVYKHKIYWRPTPRDVYGTYWLHSSSSCSLVHYSKASRIRWKNLKIRAIMLISTFLIEFNLMIIQTIWSCKQSNTQLVWTMQTNAPCHLPRVFIPSVLSKLWHQLRNCVHHISQSGSNTLQNDLELLNK